MRRFTSAGTTYQVTDVEYAQLLARFNTANLKDGRIDVACICPSGIISCRHCSLGNGEGVSQNCSVILKEQGLAPTYCCLLCDCVEVTQRGVPQIQKIADWLATWEYVPMEDAQRDKEIDGADLGGHDALADRREP